MKILIVEDDDEFAEALAGFLRREGHEVDIARNVPSALSLLVGSRPQVLLVDIALPVFDGTVLAREVRARGLDCRVIALTGRADFVAPPEFDLLLHKPLFRERLLKALAG